MVRFPSALPLTRPGVREEIFHLLLLQRRAAAVTIGKFRPVNKELMASEPTVISSLAAAISLDISR